MYKSKTTIEYIIYILFWGALFLSPLWDYAIGGSAASVEWSKIYRFWLYLLPAFILFFINNNLLMPFLLLNKKRERRYLLYLICIIALVYLGSLLVTPTARHIPPHKRSAHMMEHHNGGMPPHEAPRMPVYVKALSSQATIHDFFYENKPHRVKMMPPAGRYKDFPFALSHPDSVQILLTVFVLVFNICVRLFFLTLRNDEHLREVEKEKLRTELDYLKYQINPHFFMNTLNNIHSLIDIDAQKAQEAVIGLSKMMRHVLYDAHSPFVSLEKEIEFLNSYVELMRLRYTSALKVDTRFPACVDGYKVPSLLFVSFLENAFKHGVSYNRESVIAVDISIDDHNIVFACRNSCDEDSAASEINRTYSGIGIDNVRKRLSLIYGEDYSINIEKDKTQFSVILKIPIQNDKVYIN